VHAGHLLGRDENMYSFFEGVKVEGTAGANAMGEGRKGSSAGAHVLPAATQVRFKRAERPESRILGKLEE